MHSNARHLSPTLLAQYPHDEMLLFLGKLVAAGVHGKLLAGQEASMADRQNGLNASGQGTKRKDLGYWKAAMADIEAKTAAAAA
eukprot:15926-Eustigmatos_ZCMA.PRE.1